MKSRSESDAVEWLRELADSAEVLPRERSPKPYWSQRGTGRGGQTSTSLTLEGTVRAIRRLVDEFTSDHFFAQRLGFDCVDGHGEPTIDPVSELDERVGRGILMVTQPHAWTEDDLCDFIEVFHDLSARPRELSYHDYANCGWHPSSFSIRSGQALFRWRVNQILERSTLDLVLAEAGEDEGRMVRVAPSGVTRLVEEVLASPSEARSEIEHAVALFRLRGGTREDQRSAIVALARILEDRRPLLESNLTRKDEGALFRIANEFDLRHHNTKQLADYGEEFLEWIFYWYLATVALTERLLTRADPRH